MKNRKFRNMSISNRIFYVFNFIFWAVAIFIVVYPLYLVCIASISDADAVSKGEVIWRPKGIMWDGYEMVLHETRLWVSYANSIFYVIAGVLIAVTITLMAAYVMSRREFFGKSILTWYILFIMFFSGGLIPTFLVVRDIGLYNTRAILIILGCFSVWNLMVTRVYIQTSIPEELYEAATLDGATDFQYFFKVVVPLSKTILAVLAVYYGVGKWNDYFSGVVYIKDEALLPLQTVLKQILAASQVNMSDEALISTAEDMESLIKARKVANIAKYCIIVVSTAPAVILYTSMQKYFEKGVMIGSLKG